MKPIMLVVLLAAPAAASDLPIDLEADTPVEHFDSVRQALDTGQYAEISASDRRTVLELLGRMQEQLGDGGLQAPNDAQRTRLFDLQDAGVR